MGRKSAPFAAVRFLALSILRSRRMAAAATAINFAGAVAFSLSAQQVRSDPDKDSAPAASLLLISFAIGYALLSIAGRCIAGATGDTLLAAAATAAYTCRDYRAFEVAAGLALGAALEHGLMLRASAAHDTLHQLLDHHRVTERLLVREMLAETQPFDLPALSPWMRQPGWTTASAVMRHWLLVVVRCCVMSFLVLPPALGALENAGALQPAAAAVVQLCVAVIVPWLAVFLAFSAQRESLVTPLHRLSAVIHRLTEDGSQQASAGRDSASDSGAAGSRRRTVDDDDPAVAFLHSTEDAAAKCRLACLRFRQRWCCRCWSESCSRQGCSRERSARNGVTVLPVSMAISAAAAKSSNSVAQGASGSPAASSSSRTFRVAEAELLRRFVRRLWTLVELGFGTAGRSIVARYLSRATASHSVVAAAMGARRKAAAASAAAMAAADSGSGAAQADGSAGPAGNSMGGGMMSHGQSPSGGAVGGASAGATSGGSTPTAAAPGDSLLRGERVFGIFCFADVCSFTEITDVLQEDVLPFGELTHGL